MKEQLQQYIQDYNLSKQEIWEHLNELSKTDCSKMSSEEKQALECAFSSLQREYDMIKDFIIVLENISL